MTSHAAHPADPEEIPQVLEIRAERPPVTCGETPLAILSRSFRPIDVPVHAPNGAAVLVGIYLLIEHDTITYVGSSAHVVYRLYKHATELRCGGAKRFDRAIWLSLPESVHPHYEGALIRSLCPRDNGAAPRARGHDVEILDGLGLAHLSSSGAEWRSQMTKRPRRERPDANSLGARITVTRKAKKWSVERLATELGLCRTAVWKWELGSSEPSRSNLLELARVLGSTVQWLVFGAAVPS